jgi:hypothetical protein
MATHRLHPAQAIGPLVCHPCHQLQLPSCGYIPLSAATQDPVPSPLSATIPRTYLPTMASAYLQ